MRASRVMIISVLITSAALNASAQQPAPPVPQPATPKTEQPAKQTFTKEETQIMFELMMAQLQARTYALSPDTNKDAAGATDKLSELYLKIVQDPKLFNSVVGTGLNEFLSLKEGARGAAQVSQAADELGVKFQMMLMAQNQVIIEQNKRIIDLLEQIAKKR